jgi:hypothetical protein
VVLILSLSSFYAFNSFLYVDWLWVLPQTFIDSFSFIMLYTALAVSYVTTYSAVQADSPSLTMLLKIEEGGSRGLARDELEAHLNDEVIIIPRLNDLVTGKLVIYDNRRYIIGPRGSMLAKSHILYRRLLRMEKGA